ncbi:hypothetical protein Vafri_15119, partial [Volvox africanus]
MASQPAGGQFQHGNHANGFVRRDQEVPPLDNPSRRPTLAADDADAANILQAWDRARAAQHAGVKRGVHTDSGVGPDLNRGAAGSVHDDDLLGHSGRRHPLPPSSDNLARGLLCAARYQHSSAQSCRQVAALSTDSKVILGGDTPSSDASPRDWVRKAKQRRNSYSVPQSIGVPELPLPGPVASVSHQGKPQSSSGAPRQGRRLPPRRATLQDLKADLPGDVNSSSGAAPVPPQNNVSWTGLASPGHLTSSPAPSQVPGSPKPHTISGRDGTPVSSSGQHAAQMGGGGDSPGGMDQAGIRRKIIKMISIQRTKQKSTAGSSKPLAQASQPTELQEPPTAVVGDTDEDQEPSGSRGITEPGAAGGAPSVGQGAAAVGSAQSGGRSARHDSDDEDVEDARPSGPPPTAWNMGGGVVGPSTSELRMMGAANSVSFKKSTMKQGVLRPLSTLPPFVPRLFIEDITLNHEKYRGFDAAGRDLTAASKTLQPSIIELQAAVMIADVTGFTKLTEILSKKGTSGVELLTTCMNNYFTRAINMIMAFEGDVVKFAGDSMIVLFYPNEHERRHADKGLRACTLRMMSCAHQLATKLGHMRMKMNGQVEPAPPPAPEPPGQTPPPPHSALVSAPLPSTLLPAVSNIVSAEMDPGADGVLPTGAGGGSGGIDGGGGGGGVGRNTSGAFSRAGVRRVAHGESPRSSATNQPLSPTGCVEETSFVGTDASSRVLDGPDFGQAGSSSAGGGGGSGGGSSTARKRGKSWNLMANVLKGKVALPRRNDVCAAPGSVSSAAATSSGAYRASFEKTEAKAVNRVSARERAKTETGLGLTIRGVNGLGGNGASAATDSGINGASGGAGLWAGGEGVVRREMSVATKLNLPPPLRPMQARASAMISPLNTMGSGGGASGAGSTPPSASLATGIYTGSGNALMGLANSALSPTSGSPRSFTEQAAASGGSFRRAPLGGRSERRATGGQPLSAVGPGTGDWRSKLQNLSTAIVNAGPGGGPGVRGEDDPLAPQRSRLSESTRAVRWDTVQEEEALDEAEDGMVGSDQEEEDASYPPIRPDSQGGSGSSSPQHGHIANTRGSGQSSSGGSGGSGSSSVGTAAVSPPPPPPQQLERIYSSVGSQSAGGSRNPHVVDLRRKLLLRASQSDREDLQLRRGGGSGGGSGGGGG